MSKATVKASVAPNDRVIASQVSRTRSPSAPPRQEEREEEQVGQAELRRVRLAGDGERERERREQLALVRDDLLRRPAPDRDRVDPRDDHGHESQPRQTSRRTRGTTTPASVTAPSFAKFARTSRPTSENTTASTATHDSRAAGAGGIRQSGSTS